MRTKTLALTVLFILASVAAFAQVSPKKFILMAETSKSQFKKGESFVIKYTVKFNAGWHTYSFKPFEDENAVGPLATTLTIGPSGTVVLKGNIKAPKGKKEYDKQFEMDVVTWAGTLNFEIPAVALKDIDLKKDRIFMNINLQQCNATTCLPPDDFKIYLGGVGENLIDSGKPQGQPKESSQTTSDTSKLEPSAATGTKADSAKTTKSENESHPTEEQSIWTTIIIGVAGGAASLLTPCVFPMVPITVSFFTKRLDNKKGKGLRDALVYALGIIGTFSGLGIIISLIFGASSIQTFSTSPAVSIVIGAIFVVFALSLFGAFELQLPTGLLNKLNAKSTQGNGLGSVLLMGLTFSLASFSCTGPIVGTALALAGKGEWFHPLVSMLSFSTVLAAPFFLLALFPNAMSALPRAGGWMNNIKVVMAFILMAASLKFLNAALTDWGIGIPREFFLAIWIGCCLLVSLYILGVFRMSHDAPVQGMGVPRVLFSLLFMAFTMYFLAGLFGKPMGFFEAYLPLPGETAQTASILPVAGASQSADAWLEDYPAALARAKTENKSILIDFSGRHCVNCRLMERNVFPKVTDLMNKMIKVRLITDVGEEPFISNKNLQNERFSTVALPFYAIISPDDKVIATSAFTSDEKEFADFLKKGIK